MTTSNIFDFWPMKDSVPRQTQKTTLEWIEQLPAHVKYILCEIPVGGGKSPLAINYSGWIGNGGDAYILTPQKILQKQYEDSFDSAILTSLYGKSNYTCASKKTNCDIGGDIKPRCDSCPHKLAMSKASQSKNVVLNYALALLLFKYMPDTKLVPRRKTIVFDEAHTLEHHLTEFNAIVINEKKCKYLGVPFTAHKSALDAFNWVRDVYFKKLEDKVSHLSSIVKDIEREKESNGDETLSNEEINILNSYKEYKRHIDMLRENIITVQFSDFDNKFVFVAEQYKSFKFKELYGKHIFKNILENKADRFLFMSSTILDKDAFCKDLGLDPDKAAFISLGSEFEPSNRPVLYKPTMRMNFGWDKPERRNERKEMLKEIINICNNHHAVDSGIVHTGSFQVAKWLVEELEGMVSHKILHHNPSNKIIKTRDVVIDEFLTSDITIPKLLISPSITEGLDLKHDLGRFAIIAKVPYPYLGDAWVKRRMDLSSEWYRRQALISIIQGGGRIVRAKDDWGYVYILDASFTSLYNQMVYKIPKWWKDGYIKA